MPERRWREEGIDWDGLRDLIALQFAELKRCALSVESFLRTEANRMEANFAEQSLSLPDEERSEFLRWSYGDPGYSDLIDTFPNILRYALFIRGYSAFERALACIAESCHWERKLDLTQSDLQGKGIQRSAKYLKKVAKIPFPNSSCWRDILA